MTLRTGEMLGLAGQLGSGAEFLLRALAGRQPFTGGAVELGGQATRSHSVRQAIQAGIAYCSGDRKRDGLFAIRSVSENLSAPAVKRITTVAGSSDAGRRAGAVAGRLLPGRPNPAPAYRQDVERRQPAEGRTRQVDEHRAAHPSRRRADHGRRRRGPRRDLRPPAAPRGPRSRRHLHIVGSAGGDGPLRHDRDILPRPAASQGCRRHDERRGRASGRDPSGRDGARSCVRDRRASCDGPPPVRRRLRLAISEQAACARAPTVRAAGSGHGRGTRSVACGGCRRHRDFLRRTTPF